MLGDRITGRAALGAAITATLALAFVALTLPPLLSAQDGAPAGPEAAVKPLAGCDDQELAPNDDSSTLGGVALPFTLHFFDEDRSTIYVNNNGNVTFGNFLSGSLPLPLQERQRDIIAPFFADVDTEGAGSGIVTYGNTVFETRAAFCVMWPDVGYFNNRVDKLNSFQLLLVDRSDTGAGNFDIVFNYDQIEWESSQSSGGVDGLGGQTARAGYADGAALAYELPGSAVAGAFLDTNIEDGLIHNSFNSATPGRYVFPVRGGLPEPIASAPPTPTATPTATATPPGLAGDADCSGTVNAIDAAIVLQFGAGLLGAVPCGALSDVNEDGVTNAVDAAIILQYVAGLIESLPV